LLKRGVECGRKELIVEGEAEAGTGELSEEECSRT
jgi:hypothetical protein